MVLCLSLVWKASQGKEYLTLERVDRWVILMITSFPLRCYFLKVKKFSALHVFDFGSDIVQIRKNALKPRDLSR